MCLNNNRVKCNNKTTKTIKNKNKNITKQSLNLQRIMILGLSNELSRYYMIKLLLKCQTFSNLQIILNIINTIITNILV